jgi:hypothetical protein
LYCWQCGTKLEDPLRGKLSFRETCDKCNVALHCCRNCKYYKPGLANDCAVPNTEFVSDRQINNFCEEFTLSGIAPSSPNTPSRKKFDDLFN